MNLLNVLLMMPSSEGGSGAGMSQIIMLVAIVVIFYFFMIRPQTKKAKEEKKFREALQKGQRIITIGGVHGKIIDVKETTVVLEIANEVRIEIEKSAIAVDLTKVTETKK